MLHEVTLVPITSLVPSQTPMQVERRKHRTESDIQGIADSIKSIGRVIHAIVARPLGDDGTLEIVAGEGRYLAAQRAGLTEMPVTIWELSDEQAEEVQLVENLQRNDLHELVEAEGYEALLKRGHTAEEIAEKVGKSKRTIYTRLQLLQLEPEAREAFRRGALSASTAMLIARIPTAALQRQALEEIIRGSGSDDDEGMSYREALAHVRRRYMLALNQAPFDTGDEQLVPEAGACGRCPKRTGNQPELFEDVGGADVCTDPNCFDLKTRAQSLARVTSAKESGQRVIEGEEAEEVVTYENDFGGLGVDAKYVLLDAKTYIDGKHKSYKELLPPDTKPILLTTPKGQVVELLERKAADKLVNAAGFGQPSASSSPSTKKQTAEAQRREKDHKFAKALLAAIYQKAQPKSLRHAVQGLLVEQGPVFDLGAIVEALGWDDFNLDRVNAELSKLTDAEFARFVYVLQFDSELGSYAPQPHQLTAAAKALRINVDKLREGANAEEEPNPKPKPKPKPTATNKKSTPKKTAAKAKKPARKAK